MQYKWEAESKKDHSALQIDGCSIYRITNKFSVLKYQYPVTYNCIMSPIWGKYEWSDSKLQQL